MLKPGTYKLHGIEWEYDGHYWNGTMYERFHLMTWQFGDIWQCGLRIDYDKFIEPEGWGIGNRIGLKHTRSRDDSMKKAISWTENYLENGLPTPEEVFLKCYKTYPTLYKRRIEIINHIFFTLGGGYNWLDGQICNESPEDERVSQYDRFSLSRSEIYKTKLEACRLLVEYDKKDYEEKYKICKQEFEEVLLEEKIEKDPLKYLPLPDDGNPYKFYPASHSSNILTIPEDVTDEWLIVCYEAVKLFTNRGCNPKNKKLRKSLIKDFEGKYKGRLAQLP